MVVKNARPWAVMSSYNYLNGTHVDMQKRLLTSILRDEWGFQGFVMSDWGGTNSTAESLAAGLDLEMPGPPVRRGERLLQSLSEGKVDLDTIDKSVRNVLCTIASVHLIGANDNESKNHSINIDLSAQRKLLHEAAVNGTVLLRNNGILPLDRKKIEKLAIIGPNAKTPTVGGSGSAALNPYDISTPYDACAAIARAENPDIKISFEQGILTNKLCPLIPTILLSENRRDPGVRIDFYEGLDLQGEIVGIRIWQTTNIFMMSDGDLPSSLAGKDYSFCVSGTIIPEVSGEYVLGVTSTGRSKLYINDKLVVDNSAWTEISDTFMSRGSKEARGKISLQMRHQYELRLEQASAPPHGLQLQQQDNTLFGSLSGVRIGWNQPLDEERMLLDAISTAKASETVILVVGMNNEWEREGGDRSNLYLPRRTDELIIRICEANSNTIVINQSGCPVSMAAWFDKPAAILQTFYQGMECGNAISSVLFGKENPSGKLSVTFPRKLEDHGTSGNFLGDLENDIVEFKEGLLFGYRWFDFQNIEPQWEFGFDLSYTQFELSNVHIQGHLNRNEGSRKVNVIALLANIGARHGMETVQVYIEERPTETKLTKEYHRWKSLRGFQKVALRGGEAMEIKIPLGLESVQRFDVEKKKWVIDKGEYNILVGFSSRDIKQFLRLSVW